MQSAECWASRLCAGLSIGKDQHCEQNAEQQKHRRQSLLHTQPDSKDVIDLLPSKEHDGVIQKPASSVEHLTRFGGFLRRVLAGVDQSHADQPRSPAEGPPSTVTGSVQAFQIAHFQGIKQLLIEFEQLHVIFYLSGANIGMGNFQCWLACSICAVAHRPKTADHPGAPSIGNKGRAAYPRALGDYK
eukprot:scaffold56224_cov17-Tisochrysis_lutea.AAC.4